MLKTQFDRFLAEGFDELGAFIMVIDGFPAEERLQPTIELLESLGYRRSKTADVDEDEYGIKTPGGQASEAALRAFFVKFKIGRYLIQYQPLHRFILRGKSCIPHRPGSDLRIGTPSKEPPLRNASERLRINWQMTFRTLQWQASFYMTTDSRDRIRTRSSA